MKIKFCFFFQVVRIKTEAVDHYLGRDSRRTTIKDCLAPILDHALALDSKPTTRLKSSADVPDRVLAPASTNRTYVPNQDLDRRPAPTTNRTSDDLEVAHHPESPKSASRHGLVTTHNITLIEADYDLT